MAQRRSPARDTTSLPCCPCTSCCACPRAATPGPLRPRRRASGRGSERAAAARCGGRRTLAALPVDGLHVLALAQLVADVGQQLCGRGRGCQAKRSAQALGATRRDVARARAGPHRAPPRGPARASAPQRRPSWLHARGVRRAVGVMSRVKGTNNPPGRPSQPTCSRLIDSPASQPGCRRRRGSNACRAVQRKGALRHVERLFQRAQMTLLLVSAAVSCVRRISILRIRRLCRRDHAREAQERLLAHAHLSSLPCATPRATPGLTTAGPSCASRPPMATTTGHSTRGSFSSAPERGPSAKIVLSVCGSQHSSTPPSGASLCKRRIAVSVPRGRHSNHLSLLT